jgi:hypothetical protein
MAVEKALIISLSLPLSVAPEIESNKRAIVSFNIGQSFRLFRMSATVLLISCGISMCSIKLRLR